MYSRKLLEVGVGIWFDTDGILNLDKDGELRLSIFSALAQDESAKKSEAVRFGQQEAIKRGTVFGFDNMFGFRKRDGKLEIDESEAPAIRKLFELYATDQYSMKQIETIFWEKGYRNLNGKKIAHTTMSNMISNPKYKGYYVGNKVKVVDMFTKKQKFLPPEEWVMFKDETGEIVPAIVSEEIWDAANAVLKKRSEDVKARQGVCNHANLLTGKLWCTECGQPYYRRESEDKRGRKNSKWLCSGKIKNGADSCASFPIYEDEIKPLLLDVFRDTEASAEALIEEYVEMFKSLDRGGRLGKQITILQKQLETVEQKRMKLLTYNAQGKLDDADFLAMNKKCSAEAKELQTQLAEALAQQESTGNMKQQLDTIRSVLRNAQKDVTKGVITKEFVTRYIDKIFATPEEDGSLRLDIKIFTGETCEKHLQNLRRQAAAQTAVPSAIAAFSPTGDPEVSTGHTFKKMIESYEKNL